MTDIPLTSDNEQIALTYINATEGWNLARASASAGKSNLVDLKDVDSSNLVPGAVLQFDGTSFKFDKVSGGGSGAVEVVTPNNFVKGQPLYFDGTGYTFYSSTSGDPTNSGSGYYKVIAKKLF